MAIPVGAAGTFVGAFNKFFNASGRGVHEVETLVASRFGDVAKHTGVLLDELRVDTLYLQGRMAHVRVTAPTESALKQALDGLEHVEFKGSIGF